MIFLYEFKKAFHKYKGHLLFRGLQPENIVLDTRKYLKETGTDATRVEIKIKRRRSLTPPHWTRSQ